MKIGIKLLLLGVFVAFTAVAFSQTATEGEKVNIKFKPEHMRKIDVNNKFVQHKKALQLQSIEMPPSKAICPRKPISK